MAILPRVAVNMVFRSRIKKNIVFVVFFHKSKQSNLVQIFLVMFYGNHNGCRSV